jgi:hypothetical protein
MTATLFLALTLALASGILIGGWRYLSRPEFIVLAAGLPLWLTYVGILSLLGVVRDTNLSPPGIAYIFGPIFLFMILFAVRSKAGGGVAARIPLGLLMGAQSFRVLVELGLHRLGDERLVPQLMTYTGGNVDIAIGISAPVVAWLYVTGRIGPKLALGWNVVGLLALANVATRAVLTAPGPLNFVLADVPNMAIGMFPYTYLAGFFAPFAMLLHILSIRALRALSSNPNAHGVSVKANRPLKLRSK